MTGVAEPSSSSSQMASPRLVKVQHSDIKPDVSYRTAKTDSPPFIIVLFIRLLRPFAPQLVPLFVLFALIPLVVFLSFLSGWYVWKNTAVGWEAELYLQYGDGVSPYAQVLLPQLSAVHPYDISLHLVVPAYEANYALGNFMASLTLLTPSNKTLTTVRRPAIVMPPRHGYLFSSSPPSIDLDISLLSSYVSRTSTLSARVEIGRRDEWKDFGSGGRRELSVLAGSLKGRVNYQGVRGLISRFPLISAMVSCTGFFVVLMIMLAACILPTIRWRFPGTEEPVTSPPRSRRLVKEEKPFRAPKRQRTSYLDRSRSLNPYKTEDIPGDISFAAQDDSPVRRRRLPALHDSDD